MERSKRRVFFVSLATVLVLSLTLFGCGGGGGGGGGSDTSTIDPQEAEVVEGAYIIFEEYYIYPNSVREPDSGETLEEYVNSYRSPNDIYTTYLDESELENVDEVLGTDETLIVRTYPPSILYIAFEKFVTDTAYRAIETINSHISQGYDELIIDLRVNSGGDPDEAVYLLDYFTTSQPVNTFLGGYYGPAVYKEYYLGDSTYLYGIENIFDSSNMYILTSAYTASASELLIAGLIDFNEATQIGSTTFGKSRVITFFDHTRGDGFEITIGTVLHSDNMDREAIGIIPASNNLTTDPFILAMSRLSVDSSDQLQEDWEISDAAFANLYSQSYWRDRVYSASVTQSLRMLRSPR